MGLNESHVTLLEWAIVGLLYQIDDLKNHDELTWESHFDDTIPCNHARQLVRLSATGEAPEVSDADMDEFQRWLQRCNVAEYLYLMQSNET